MLHGAPAHNRYPAPPYVPPSSTLRSQAHNQYSAPPYVPPPAHCEHCGATPKHLGRCPRIKWLVFDKFGGIAEIAYFSPNEMYVPPPWRRQGS